MQQDLNDERSVTDDRISENQIPAPVAPVTRKDDTTEPDGFAPGQSDDRRSPLDGVFYDPKPAT